MNAMQFYPREIYVKLLLNHRENLSMQKTLKIGIGHMTDSEHYTIGHFFRQF